jgi:hypothetical protein
VGQRRRQEPIEICLNIAASKTTDKPRQTLPAIRQQSEAAFDLDAIGAAARPEQLTLCLAVQLCRKRHRPVGLNGERLVTSGKTVDQ